MHARYYDSRRVPFLAVDPIWGHSSKPRLWNRDAYVNNNPISYSDPTGERRLGVSEAVGLAVLATRFIVDPIGTAKDLLHINQVNDALEGMGPPSSPADNPPRLPCPPLPLTPPQPL